MATKDSKLRFSIATLEQAGAIQELVQAAFRADDSREDWTADVEMNRRFVITVEDIADKITHPDSVYLVATFEGQDDRLVACFGVAKRENQVARLFNLAVDPAYHRLGLGKKILVYTEAYAKNEVGATKLSIDALSTRKELIAWYLRFGFQKTGELVPFPVKIEGLTLPEDLSFVQMEKDI